MAEIIIKNYEELKELIIKNLKDGTVVSIEFEGEEDAGNVQESRNE